MKQMIKDQVIVCLPTRNEVESIEIMIDKIRALELPLFISDANSTDGTLDIAQQKGVEVFQAGSVWLGLWLRHSKCDVGCSSEECTLSGYH